MTSVALVIDDEVQIRRLLRVSLETQGFVVHDAATAEEGLRMVLGKKPDIVLLDLGLPDRDGAEALRELRTWSSVPVIILSVRNAEEEIVRLLDTGADDYVVKPFNTGELIARMRVAIRHRAPQEAQDTFVSGRLAVDLLDRTVKVAGEPVKLTPDGVWPAAPVRAARGPHSHPWSDPARGLGPQRGRGDQLPEGLHHGPAKEDRGESPDARAHRHRARRRVPASRPALTLRVPGLKKDARPDTVTPWRAGVS